MFSLISMFCEKVAQPPNFGGLSEKLANIIIPMSILIRFHFSATCAGNFNISGN